MTREDIIRMTREAWFGDGTENVHVPKELERFAALVAAAEREKVAAWMIQRGYATGHGDTTEDLLGELDWQVLANWSSAMKTGAENEREACAQILDGVDSYANPMTANDCAAAIRARRNA